jgi:hypothetical protein
MIGTVDIKLRIRDARSLKDKRRVLNALKDRLRNGFNISIAEVDQQDILQSATLSVAQVSTDSRYLNSSLDKLIDAVRRFRAAELVDYHTDVF